MHLPRFLRSFCFVFVLFILIDGFWHNGIMADFYTYHLSPVLYGMLPGLSWKSVTLIGINSVTMTYIIQSHIEQNKGVADLIFVGALLGFTVVGSINLLNMHLIHWWDVQMAFVDTLWGTIVGIVGALAVMVTTPTKKRSGFFGFLKRK